MELSVTSRRRWVGALALVAALAMLVVGLTVLQGRLDALGFVIYWMVCFAFVGLALVMAFLDMRSLQNQTREEQRRLLETTIQEIQTDARSKQRRNGRNGERGEKR